MDIGESGIHRILQGQLRSQHVGQACRATASKSFREIKSFLFFILSSVMLLILNLNTKFTTLQLEASFFSLEGMKPSSK